MALDKVSNFAKTTITGITSGATEVVLDDAINFLDPASGEYNCVIWEISNYGNPADDPNKEIVRATALSGNTLTITRAQEGTTASNHNTGGETYAIANVLTSKMITDIETELNAKAPLISPSFTGNITLENTTSSTTGVILKGTNSFIHNFQHQTGQTAVPEGYNTFVGINSGNFTMGSTATQTYHGSYNTGIGYSSLSSNTTGHRNTGIGYTSLSSNITGRRNTGIGNASLSSNTTGYQNTALGTDSGIYIDGGTNPNQTSNNSVYLGYDTRALADGDTNEIVIGTSAIGAGSNTVTLGNTSITKTVLRGAVEGSSLALEGTTLKMLSLKNTDANSYTRMLFDGTGVDFAQGVGNANAAITDLRNKFYIYDFTNSKTAFTIVPNTLAAKLYGSLEVVGGLTGTVTLPKTTEVQDTTGDHQYVLAVSELTADRTVTLPLLTGDDTFLFKDFHKATSTEINTGTENDKYVTPDQLAGSNAFTKVVQEICVDFTTELAVADGVGYIVIPAECNGMNLISARADVITAGTTNASTFDIYNVTDSTSMLSSAISIASGAKSGTGTVDEAHDDVATGDIIRIDVDTLSTTKPKGLIVTLAFRLP